MKRKQEPGSRTVKAIVLVALVALSPSILRAQATLEQIAGEIGLDQKLDVQVPPELSFRDEGGREVHLRDYFDKRPVILALVYHECPMLCTQVLNGLLRCLRTLSFDVGEEFDVMVVSIDPGESHELAARKKAECIKRYGRSSTAPGWHFLTGEETSIRRLADTVGYRYFYDARSDQFAHASGVILLTPEGRTARYFYGIEYPPRDLRLSLVEASAGKIGSLVDQVLLLCLQWDPGRGKYGLVIMNVIQLAGGVTVLSLALFVVVALRRDRITGRRAEGQKNHVD